MLPYLVKLHFLIATYCLLPEVLVGLLSMLELFYEEYSYCHHLKLR